MALLARLMVGGGFLFGSYFDLGACGFAAAFLFLTIKINLLLIGPPWLSQKNSEFSNWLRQTISLAPLKNVSSQQNADLLRFHAMEIHHGVSQSENKLKLLVDVQKEILDQQKKRIRVANDMSPFFDLFLSGVTLVCTLLFPIFEI